MIFDEATLGLDVMVARNLLGIIRDLRNAGKCLIFSTHIMSEVEKLCDRIAIMHQGRILDTGTLVELRERHGEEDFEELFFSPRSYSGGGGGGKSQGEASLEEKGGVGAGGKAHAQNKKGGVEGAPASASPTREQVVKRMQWILEMNGINLYPSEKSKLCK